jgi:CheY-like chemotaxis protein
MSSRKAVLVVEDDAVISASIRELLEDNDYKVITAANGHLALEALKKSAAPAVILLDLMMPIMDGFTFRRNQLADSSLCDIPVIVMSADGHVEEKRIRASTEYYLKKPVDIFLLLETVARVASGRP